MAGDETKILAELLIPMWTHCVARLHPSPFTIVLPAPACMQLQLQHSCDTDTIKSSNTDRAETIPSGLIVGIVFWPWPLATNNFTPHLNRNETKPLTQPCHHLLPAVPRRKRKAGHPNIKILLHSGIIQSRKRRTRSWQVLMLVFAVVVTIRSNGGKNIARYVVITCMAWGNIFGCIGCSRSNIALLASVFFLIPEPTHLTTT